MVQNVPNSQKKSPHRQWFPPLIWIQGNVLCTYNGFSLKTDFTKIFPTKTIPLCSVKCSMRETCCVIVIISSRPLSGCLGMGGNTGFQECAQ